MQNNALKRMYALGRLKAGQMNKTEAEFAEYLKQQEFTGAIVSFSFEAVKLRLANNTFYTPDFFAMNSDQTITLYEVKGLWRDDARAKIKVAADKFPMFRFVAVQKQAKKHGGGWTFEEF